MGQKNQESASPPEPGTLKYLRMARGLEQKNLADAAGVGRGMISKLEARTYAVKTEDGYPLSVLVDTAKYLSVTPLLETGKCKCVTAKDVALACGLEVWPSGNEEEDD